MLVAHIRNNPDGTQNSQSICEHCHHVAELASNYASSFSADKIAYYTGMYHDVGKYSDAFQRRIHGSSEMVDHSTAGTIETWNTHTHAGLIASFCIGGHHSGLPDYGSRFDMSSDGTLLGKLKRTPEPYDVFKDEISLDPPIVTEVFHEVRELYFLIRMVFSALVDADYTDTEFFLHNNLVEKLEYDSLSVLDRLLDNYVSKWKNPQNDLDRKRSLIKQAVIDRAEEERSIFTLTVPTGGGKTITSVAFALKHALANGLERVIYVIPYTSIIEQTQRVFEDIFGENNVIAHYANVEYSNSDLDLTKQRYLACENWEAPIIITTSVQFFESLYSNRPSQSRKLHNIANSVVIFDEAQMLPQTYIRPCVLAITELVKRYRCSAILCTATQPSLNRIISEYVPNIAIQELCPNDLFVDSVFRRVKYQQCGQLSDTELAELLQRSKQVLCIVNTRKQAQLIYRLLPCDGKYHLSTWMTPEHRRKVIDAIRLRLDQGLECRVVSTSLIEAGVDIDFPIVYRELAGLDSIIQAGGRCNREGKRSENESVVRIFNCHSTSSSIEKNISATKRVLRDTNEIASKMAISSYFDFLLYTLVQPSDLDIKCIAERMDKLAFATINNEFELIEGNDYSIYIPDFSNEKTFSELKKNGPTKSLFRKLGRYSVSVSHKVFQKLISEGKVEQIADNAAILNDMSFYSPNIGLVVM